MCAFAMNTPHHQHLQMDLITQQAMRAGFTGGVVVDYPNSTRAKKYVWCVYTHLDGCISLYLLLVHVIFM